MRRTASVVVLGLLLAACARAADTSGEIAPRLGGEGAVEAPATTAPAAAPDFDDGDLVDVRFDIVSDRKIIRRASLSLHATDTRSTYEDIVRLTESVGGFVAQADISSPEDTGEQPEVSVTVRIPARDLATTLTAFKELADEVVSETQGTQDVTEEFVDLEARLTNLRALEIELRALLEEVRKQPDADPEKLLRVFNEISSVRGEIEQIQGRINLLTDLTELATVEIFITQTPKAAPIVEEPWEPLEVARESLRDLVGALQTIGGWAINFAVLVLPLLILALGIPLAAGYTVYRRVRNRRGGPTEPEPMEP